MWRERGPRDLKELRKKATLCIFNRNRKKIKSEWFLSNTLLIYPLFPCEVEGPSSNVLPSIRGVWITVSTPQEDSLSTGWHYKSSWVGFSQFWPQRLKLFQPTLKCCAKRRTRNWYIYFRSWTSAGSEGHFMPNLCSPSSRKKDLNLELSAHRQTLSLGQLLYCVPCDLHQQPLADCESMTKISSLFTLK